jgi:hypothetical protein
MGGWQVISDHSMPSARSRCSSLAASCGPCGSTGVSASAPWPPDAGSRSRPFRGSRAARRQVFASVGSLGSSPVSIARPSGQANGRGTSHPIPRGPSRSSGLPATEHSPNASPSSKPRRASDPTRPAVCGVRRAEHRVPGQLPAADGRGLADRSTPGVDPSVDPSAPQPRHSDVTTGITDGGPRPSAVRDVTTGITDGGPRPSARFVMSLQASQTEASIRSVRRAAAGAESAAC